MSLVHIVWWENDEGDWDFESVFLDYNVASEERDHLEREEGTPWVEYYVTTLEAK